MHFEKIPDLSHLERIWHNLGPDLPSLSKPATPASEHQCRLISGLPSLVTPPEFSKCFRSRPPRIVLLCRTHINCFLQVEAMQGQCRWPEIRLPLGSLKFSPDSARLCTPPRYALTRWRVPTHNRELCARINFSTGLNTWPCSCMLILFLSPFHFSLFTYFCIGWD